MQRLGGVHLKFMWGFGSPRSWGHCGGKKFMMFQLSGRDRCYFLSNYCCFQHGGCLWIAKPLLDCNVPSAQPVTVRPQHGIEICVSRVQCEQRNACLVTTNQQLTWRTGLVVAFVGVLELSSYVFCPSLSLSLSLSLTSSVFLSLSRLFRAVYSLLWLAGVVVL